MQFECHFRCLPLVLLHYSFAGVKVLLVPLLPAIAFELGVETRRASRAS